MRTRCCAGSTSTTSAASAPSALTLPDRKRLEVARALATEPKLLLLDEVMAGLRPTETDRMVAILRELNRETGLTILLIEHVMRAVMALPRTSWCCTTARRSREGTPERGRARPGGDRNPISARRTLLMLTRRGPRRLLRRRPGARRRLARDRGGRDRRHRRRQRRRQDLADPHHRRHACGRRAAASFTAAPTSPAGRATRSAISASARWRKAGRCSRRCRSPKISTMGAMLPRARAARARNLEQRLCAVSRAGRAAQRRPPARCRAASSRCSRSAAA